MVLSFSRLRDVDPIVSELTFSASAKHFAAKSSKWFPGMREGISCDQYSKTKKICHLRRKKELIT